MTKKNNITSTPIIGTSFICQKSETTENGRMIEGLISMELSKRDFDICPPSAFKIAQYLQNGQIWYNHDLWTDPNGNKIPIGKCLELYAIRLEALESQDEAKNLAVVSIEGGKLVGFVSEERASALELKAGDSGLWAKIRIDVDDVWNMITAGSLNAFSWQGKAEVVEVWSPIHDRMVRQCSSVDLMEISVVPLPANEKAFFSVAKSFVGLLAKSNEYAGVSKEALDYEYAITDKATDGHYHVAQFFLENGMITGKTLYTAGNYDVKEHTHYMETTVVDATTAVGNSVWYTVEGEHNHSLNLSDVRKNLLSKGGETNFEYITTEQDAVDGHYHVGKVEILNNMIVGRTTKTIKGEDHVHSILSTFSNPVSGISNTSEHFHKLNVGTLKKQFLYKRFHLEINCKKYVSAFSDLPLASVDTAWDFGSQDIRQLLGENDNVDRLASCFVYIDESKKFWMESVDSLTGYVVYKVNTEALQLPIAKMINGQLQVVFEGVASAMATLLGANGGVEMPLEEYKKCYKHLKLYYKKFNVEPPELKEYDFSELKRELSKASILKENSIDSIIGSIDDWRKSNKSKATLRQRLQLNFPKITEETD